MVIFFFANHSTEKKDGVDVDLIMGRYNNIYNLIGGLWKSDGEKLQNIMGAILCSVGI
jgi:hypothetical protein